VRVLWFCTSGARAVRLLPTRGLRLLVGSGDTPNIYFAIGDSRFTERRPG